MALVLSVPILISCALLAVLFTWKTLFRSRYNPAAEITGAISRAANIRKESNVIEAVNEDIPEVNGEKSKMERGPETETVEHIERFTPRRHAHTEHLEEHDHHHHDHHHHHELEHKHRQNSKGSTSSPSSSDERGEEGRHTRPHRAKTDVSDGLAHRHQHQHQHHTSSTHYSLSDSSSIPQGEHEHGHRRGHTQHASIDSSHNEHQSRILPFDETHDEPAAMGQHIDDSLPPQRKYKGYEGEVKSSMHRQATGHIHRKGEHHGADSLGLEYGRGHGEKTAQRAYTVTSSSPTSSTSSSKDDGSSRATPEEFRAFLKKNARAYLDAHPMKEEEEEEEEEMPSTHEAGHSPRPPAWTVEGGPGWRHRQLAKEEARYKFLANLAGKEAWNLGKRQEAKMHADRAREHDANFKRYHEQAAAEIFASNNPRYSMNRLQRCDLHGLFVEEALRYAQDHLVRCQQAAIEKTMLVVGKGSHSSTGSPRIRPAIMQMLANTGGVVHGVHERNEGCIMVDFAVGRPH